VGHEVLGDAVVGIVEQDSHVPCRLQRNDDVYPFPGKQPASFGTLRFVLSDQELVSVEAILSARLAPATEAPSFVHRKHWPSADF
jgi:hypothetical protein